MGISEDKEKYRGGAIWIHRKIIDWEWYTDSATMRVFIHCLLRANWKEGKFFGETIPRGSFVTSYRTMARELGLTERSIRTAINHLKSTHEVTQRSTNRYTVITVVNYDEYQNSDTQSDRQVTSKRHTSDRQVTTNEESNKGNKGKKKNPKPPHRGWIPYVYHDSEWLREHDPDDGWRFVEIDGVGWAYQEKGEG